MSVMILLVLMVRVMFCRVIVLLYDVVSLLICRMGVVLWLVDMVVFFVVVGELLGDLV